MDEDFLGFWVYSFMIMINVWSLFSIFHFTYLFVYYRGYENITIE